MLTCESTSDLFRKELLRTERRSIGRLDSRFKGYDSNLATDSTEYDASEAAIRPPYTSTFNDYVRTELGYKTDLEYYILGGGIGPWNWGTNNNYVDTSTALRTALAKNPYLEDLRRGWLLRHGHALLRSRVHTSSHQYRPVFAQEFLDQLLRSRAHDVHRREVAHEAASGCFEIHRRFDAPVAADRNGLHHSIMTTESPVTQRDFEELQTDVSHSPLWNRDLAPTTIKERTWSTWNIAALWIGMSVVITTYTLAGGFIEAGMNWWQAMITILLGQHDRAHSDDSQRTCRNEVWRFVSRSESCRIWNEGRKRAGDAASDCRLRLVWNSDVDRRHGHRCSVWCDVSGLEYVSVRRNHSRSRRYTPGSHSFCFGGFKSSSF